MSQNVFFKHIYISNKEMIQSSLGLNKGTELGIFNVTYLVAKNNSLPTGTTKVCSTRIFRGKTHGFESFITVKIDKEMKYETSRPM